jgi:hypothetical protein
MALPAVTTRGCNNVHSTHYGWELAMISFISVTEPAEKVAHWGSSPDTRTWSVVLTFFQEVAGALILCLPNVMILLSPWMLYRLLHGKGGFLAACLGCSAVITWYWSAAMSADSAEREPGSADGLRIGYYLWTAGITVAFLAVRPGWRTLTAMSLVAFGLLLWHLALNG